MLEDDLRPYLGESSLPKPPSSPPSLLVFSKHMCNIRSPYISHPRGLAHGPV